MNAIDRPTPPAVAERPLLRLLERPQPRLRLVALPAPVASGWRRWLERWAGLILR